MRGIAIKHKWGRLIFNSAESVLENPQDEFFKYLGSVSCIWGVLKPNPSTFEHSPPNKFK